MALNSIRNIRGFFSDYWLGSILSAKKGVGSKLTKAQAEKTLWRLTQLRNRIEGFENPDLTRFREQFARPLLGQVLGFNVEENPEETRVRLLTRQPEEAAEGAASAPIAALYLCPDDDEIESRQTRGSLERFLADHGLSYGFIITPSLLRLIRRLGDGAKGASFDFSIASAVETEDTDSLIAAYRVLHAENFVAVNGSPKPIELLEAESRKHSARVSEDLKAAVFRAAEILIRGFLEDIQARPEAFNPKPTLGQLRDTALQTLYRLLFILYAEARDERLQRHRLYQKSYSLEQLTDRLLRLPEEELPGNRFGTWQALQALFRIYDEGLPPTPGLENIPPRGGRLFSDKTTEGQVIAKLKLSDRVAGRLVLTLATTKPRRGVGRERVSYRELEIEQLGSVYEGLLEYEPRTADQTMIEVVVQGRDFVLTPAELKRLCEQKQLVLKGDAALVAGTEAAPLHPDSVEVDEDAAAEDDGEDNDENEEEGEGGAEEDKGVKKGAPARLIRRLEKGEFYFVSGSARKASGSFYTREEIVQYLVRKALEGLVEDKPAADIESLRVIDLACGSAHFLVGAARYLGRKLLDAYHRELKADPPPEFYPDRPLTPEVRERWQSEGEAWCKRRIVERCLFGVDLNPTAVQLAQVALWIESLAGDRPLSFFAHHIRPGNSLLGTWLERLHQPPHPALDRKADQDQGGLFEMQFQRLIREALVERRLIDQPLPPDFRRDTPEEYEYKADRLKRSDDLLARARLLFDLRSAAAFVPEIWSDWATLLSTDDVTGYAMKQEWWVRFEDVRQRERFFHWELEFPEVFFGDKRGFDVVLGNPPWEKVKPDRKEFYGRADVLIRAFVGGELDARIRELHALHPGLETDFANYSDRVKTTAACLKRGDFKFMDWEIDGRSTGGDPDLFKFFIERSHQILRFGGRLGYLVPSALYNNEGCTGLRHLLLEHSHVHAFYGFENRHKLFPIDSRYKFVCLVLEKARVAYGETAGVEFRAAFMRHDIGELASPPPDVNVLVRRSELELFSPGTLAFLEFRGERDRDILLRMYGLHEGQQPRPLLGHTAAGVWQATFSREFDMHNDRDLWTRPDGRLLSAHEICGLDWPGAATWNEVRARMADQGYWPLYEGKQVEQFLTDIKPIVRWVSLEQTTRKYGEPPLAGRKLVFRRIAGNTNERTCIAAVLPEKSCANDGLPILEVREANLYDRACTLLNSFCFDYALRFRVMTHVDFTHISRVAIPTDEALQRIKVLSTQSCNGVDHVPFSERPDLFEALWDSEKSVAQAYGLRAVDLEHLLTTFPVFARKRPAFHQFLRERLAEWKAEEG
ncbi:MAG TPA: type I restriction endonuclease subunit M [Verrucomicrobiota bacterium]|nr:type I restriction endonuclease subunit M [Verrucomicrobiota bacterium]HOR72680.1 type I restriction endonuclease subunit M [Verrucomicrobiota bacterium]HOU87247.1 type I restriction endonuclease subunit M [Verrucomicrobiota bacterium]HPK97352.1 type I restriction endonuclease subunit M [Verrucomicrobiota bacterium]HQI32129.1 type I restriction endonuclease subunit M [Verrucomicrobiota bacterium]